MLVYHGTTPQLGRQFARDGIDAHLLHRRSIHGPQDGVPGLFVTPRRSVARRFGLCVIAIEVAESQLSVPPNLLPSAATVQETLAHHFEPQAFISLRIEPEAIEIVECHENDPGFNPYDLSD